MADDSKVAGSYLGMPLALWFAILTMFQTLVLSYMNQRNHDVLQKTQELQSIQHKEVKTELTGIKQEAVKTAMASARQSPITVISGDVIEEQKPADAKADKPE